MGKSKESGTSTPRSSKRLEAEIERLKQENSDLHAILQATPSAKKGTRRFCCFFGFLVAAGLFSVISLKTAVNNDLPSSLQPYANWLLTHPLVPRTARDLASTVLKDRVTSPGKLLALKGATKKHPVVFVPGLTSSALELWRTDHECAAHVAPRSRIYSGPAMSLLTTNIQCWLGHMSLNSTTWKDRDGVKVRASSGLSAADYFGFAMESLFLWGKIIRELGLLGYDEGSMHMASYDWRLSLEDLEQRDKYFTKLKSSIELLRESNNGEKVVVVAHSMGSNVFYYFMQWVSAGNGFGKPVGGIAKALGGSIASSWVEENVESVVLVGNSLMGSPKVLNSMLTGNIREVLSLWAPARSILENVLTRFDFAAIFRSWGSMGLLMPVGGSAIWGNSTWSPEGDGLGHMLTFSPSEPPVCIAEDGNVCETSSFEKSVTQGKLSDDSKCNRKSKADGEREEMTGRDKYLLQQVEAAGISEERRKHVLGLESVCEGEGGGPLDVEESHSLLREVAPHWGRLIDKNYDFSSRGSVEHKSSRWAAGKGPSTTWANPVASPLPYAPSLTMYCFHGVGVPTDRSFVLKAAPDYDPKTRQHIEEQTSNDKESSGQREEGKPVPMEKPTKEGGGLDSAALVGVMEQMARAKGGADEKQSLSEESAFPSSFGGGGGRSQNGLPFMVDENAHDESTGLENGIRTVDGDGTISAYALGLPCGHLWKDPRFNPGGAKSVLREYAHLNMDSLLKPKHAESEAGSKQKSATAVLCQDIDGLDHGVGASCMAVDLDGDGIIDTHVWDLDGDGIYDAADTTGDGLPEPLLRLPDAGSERDVPGQTKASRRTISAHKVSNATIAAAVAAAAAAVSNGSISTATSSYWDDLVSMLRDADLGAFGRGLGLAADHVNILGNNALVSDVLRIATGTTETLGEGCVAKPEQPVDSGVVANMFNWFKDENDIAELSELEQKALLADKAASDAGGLTSNQQETQSGLDGSVDETGKGMCMEAIEDRIYSATEEMFSRVSL